MHCWSPSWDLENFGSWMFLLILTTDSVNIKFKNFVCTYVSNHGFDVRHILISRLIKPSTKTYRYFEIINHILIHSLQNVLRTVATRVATSKYSQAKVGELLCCNFIITQSTNEINYFFFILYIEFQSE